MHPRYFFRQTICLSCLYVLTLLPPPSCEAELWNDRQLRKRRAKEKDFANKADVVVGKGGRGEGPSVIIRPVRHHNHHHVFSAALSRLLFVLSRRIMFCNAPLSVLAIFSSSRHPPMQLQHTAILASLGPSRLLQSTPMQKDKGDMWSEKQN